MRRPLDWLTRSRNPVHEDIGRRPTAIARAGGDAHRFWGDAPRGRGTVVRTIVRVRSAGYVSWVVHRSVTPPARRSRWRVPAPPSGSGRQSGGFSVQTATTGLARAASASLGPVPSTARTILRVAPTISSTFGLPPAPEGPRSGGNAETAGERGEGRQSGRKRPATIRACRSRRRSRRCFGRGAAATRPRWRSCCRWSRPSCGALARAYMARERIGHTLQATALVNEAFLRLVDARGTCSGRTAPTSWASRRG